jgi:hypothetical protein
MPSHKTIALQLTQSELDRILDSPVPLSLICHRAIDDWCELDPQTRQQLLADRQSIPCKDLISKTIRANPIVREWLDSYQIKNSSRTLSAAIEYHLAQNPTLTPQLVIPQELADRLYAIYPEPQAIWDAIETLLLPDRRSNFNNCR